MTLIRSLRIALNSATQTGEVYSVLFIEGDIVQLLAAVCFIKVVEVRERSRDTPGTGFRRTSRNFEAARSAVVIKPKSDIFGVNSKLTEDLRSDGVGGVLYLKTRRKGCQRGTHDLYPEYYIDHVHETHKRSRSTDMGKWSLP